MKSRLAWKVAMNGGPGRCASRAARAIRRQTRKMIARHPLSDYGLREAAELLFPAVLR